MLPFRSAKTNNLQEQGFAPSCHLGCGPARGQYRQVARSTGLATQIGRVGQKLADRGFAEPTRDFGRSDAVDGRSPVTGADVIIVAITGHGDSRLRLRNRRNHARPAIFAHRCRQHQGANRS